MWGAGECASQFQRVAGRVEVQAALALGARGGQGDPEGAAGDIGRVERDACFGGGLDDAFARGDMSQRRAQTAEKGSGRQRGFLAQCVAELDEQRIGLAQFVLGGKKSSGAFVAEGYEIGTAE